MVYFDKYLKEGKGALRAFADHRLLYF